MLKHSAFCTDLTFTNQTNLIVDSGVHPSLHESRHHQVVHCKLNSTASGIIIRQQLKTFKKLLSRKNLLTLIKQRGQMKYQSACSRYVIQLKPLSIVYKNCTKVWHISRYMDKLKYLSNSQEKRKKQGQNYSYLVSLQPIFGKVFGKVFVR